MAKTTAKCLAVSRDAKPKTPVIGVFAPCDPRIDKNSRIRAQNIVQLIADSISGTVVLPDKQAVPVVYSNVLVDSEQQADIVAWQFRKAGVDILVCVPDTWAFPQLTTISLLQQFPKETPINITCGNSGPKPGVVYAHATAGAISQYGKLISLNVGNWPDTGMNPKMTAATKTALIDFCYAAVTAVGLRGRRVIIFGHDSMGMETALAHIIPTRNTFGLEITRLDMKLLADMLNKKAYDEKEIRRLRGWIDRYLGKRLELKNAADSKRFNLSLAMYLINRDLMADLNAVGGGFMSQLEWGSDLRGTPLPVADCMESLFNITFDHTGPKAALPYATEIEKLATKLGMKSLPKDADWTGKGLVDGNNSGSASLNWAAKPGSSVKKIMEGIQMPLADPDYFPGGGNSVTFMTPPGIEGIAGRMAYSSLNDRFSLIWDQARTTEVPQQLARKMVNLTNWNWPHTFLVPKYATMAEYKQYAPANHLHMTWNLPVARLQYWMDLTGVLDVTPWAARPRFIEGVDRPQPLVHLINGGEDMYKSLKK